MEVAIDFVHYAIKSSNSLDIIWAPSSGTLPSWVCTFARPLTYQYAIPLIHSANSLNLTDVSSYAPYKASAGKSPRYSVFRNRGILSADGFIIGIIEACLSTSSDMDVMIREARSFLDSKNPTMLMERDGILCRTLVADRGDQGAMAPAWYPRALDYCLKTPSKSRVDTTHDRIPWMVKDFLLRVQDVIHDRQFVRSRSEDLFGIAPAIAREGDLICILYGRSVPVVLRKTSKVVSTDKDLYNLVGECYIDGKMNGEAVMERERQAPLEARFKEKFRII